MQLGYNTNGLADHDLASAIDLVADLGYRSIAITLNHHSLNPYDKNLAEQLAQTKQQLANRQLSVVIETGARYLLDPRRKHHPTLVSEQAEDRQRRGDFLCRAIDIATQLQATSVSLWSGSSPAATLGEPLLERLASSLAPVLNHADAAGVKIAFEPEPGHVVDTLASFGDLLQQLDSQKIDTGSLGLTVDIGHLHCLGETPIADHLRQWSDYLWNVHIEDMRQGVHEHLMFGEGQIDFPPIITTLAELHYAGPLTVELSRHSHMGPEAAEQAMQFLQPLIASPQS